MYKEILFENKNKVVTITLNRPFVSNALSFDSYKEIMEAVQQCYYDDSVGAIIITGAGKHFSAGGDIKRFKELIDSQTYLKKDSVKYASEMALTIRKCPKPVIAMINGTASGAGCSIALACDFRIVTKSSQIVMAFIKMGLSGDTGGIYYLEKLVGIGKTCEMIMTGTPVKGIEAVRIGLATKLAEEGQLTEVTYNYANNLANSPLFAIAKQKQLINEFFYSDILEYSKKETEYMVASSHTKDFEEAVNSFLEKRNPNFIGS